MVLWLSINLLGFTFAISKLPFNTEIKASIFLLCLPDCINSMQHMQINTLSIAFIILTLFFLKEGKVYLAGILTALLLFVKVYPAACGLFFLFFDNKVKYISSVIFFSIVIFALPLLFVSPAQLFQQYQNWFTSLQNDRSGEELRTCLSLISINYTWFRHPLNPLFIQLTGLLLLLAPLVRLNMYKNVQWQLNYLAAVSIFIIIFNHAAESATYIIAVTGVAIWYYNNTKSTTNNILLLIVIVGTIAAATDLFPSVIKKQFIQPYSIRAVPCVLVWIKLIVDLFKPSKVRSCNAAI
jgi:hypothetical protein